MQTSPSAVSAVAATTALNEQWIDKEAAAKRIKRSVRTVLEMVAAGTLTARKSFNDATHKTITQISVGSIENVLWQRQHDPGAALEKIPAAASSALPAVIPAAVPAALPEASSAPSAAPAAPTAALPSAPWEWLTLDEAAAMTRLPASALRDLVVANRLPAVDIGVRPGGRWRINRAALEAFRG